MLLFTFVLAPEPVRIQRDPPIDIDEDLFRRIGQNDMGALDQLYHQTERTLYAFNVSLTRDHDAAVELLQDTYLKVMSAAHLYQPMGKPLAWLFTIAKNLYYSKYRKESRVIQLEPELIANDQRFSYVTDAEDKLVLETVLKRLTEEEREIVMLHAVSGMKHQEIADSLGLKLSTTLSKYRRALEKLRTYLEEKGVRS
ncbi:RNA polymerase sigma factor [Proteiniclasticum sp. QWL-01]|uniref:RNA polymerase sigma factor n=1 Tax=Proteiniclasticum sp. QWL-01 TaxID=3036945 RepID=UPI0021FFD006|nr:RNA polymerase sigma factor [Proteiniclasticum sp. QWL-01]UUM11879.1 RNA polymerase sigma factor [Clostridiaceae bacterium HFYG-1003]WFF73369.1 RNA polymerase sigma factor [Proteiniclasticum sp. QWL-01]